MLDDELPPEAFDWNFAPEEERERGLTPTERTRKKRWLDQLLADADLYNELVVQYGREVIDRLIEEGFTARAFVRAVMLIEEDFDLWFEATGKRVSQFIGAERLALECWLWETHDRSRNPDRWKAKKSTNHDRPWPAPPFSPLARWIAHGAVLDLGGHSEHAPRNWAPRRWFRSDVIKALRKIFPGLPRNPLQISVSRALKHERASARAELATEVASDQFHQNRDGEWENTSTTLDRRAQPSQAARLLVSQKGCRH